MIYYKDFSSKKELLEWIEKNPDNIDWSEDVRVEFNKNEGN